MGAITGALRFRRYEVRGKVPDDFRERYEERLKKFAFREFEDSDIAEELTGWVAVHDSFDTDLYLDRWLADNTVVLALRTDSRKIPARILKHECSLKEEEWKARFSREHLSRDERDQVKAEVTRRLNARVLPAIRVIDIAWDLDRREVLFWSTAEKANETFRTLFEKTFEVRLRPLMPFALALKFEGEEKAGELEKVAPTVFNAGGGA